jgi:hypothetical protein
MLHRFICECLAGKAGKWFTADGTGLKPDKVYQSKAQLNRFNSA